MKTPFNADAGTHQGRFASPAAIQGSYVYELGHALPGQLFAFNPGDYNRIAQTADVTGVRAVRVRVITRGATQMPPDAAWEVRLKLDGDVVARRVLDARALTLVDLAANLHGAGLSGDHEVAVELAIVGGTGSYEAELPGCAVDALVADDAGVPLEVVNRVPQPNETRVAVGSPFEVHVESTVGSADPDDQRTTILLDGEVVYAAGSFAAGWSGSSVTPTASDGFAFSLVPTAPIAPSAAHVFQVVSALVGGPAASLTSTWSFSTVDTVAPLVTDALALREREVRVTFSEDMRQVSAADSGDALNPANYTLTLLGGWPAVTPTVVSVEPDGGNRVILTLDTPMTRRAMYRVTVLSAEDVEGNAVSAPTNTATFIGYAFPEPMVRNAAGDLVSARDFDIYRRWMPEHVRALDAEQRPGADGDLKILCAIWQEPIDLLLGLIDKVHEVFDPDLAPEAFVDLMLVENGNPFDFSMTLNEKRKLVQILVDVYRTKGTGPGIVDAIRLFMGIEVTLNVYAWSPVGLDEAVLEVDWILGSSDPQDLLTFQVIVPQVLTAAERSKMTQVIDYMMDAREFFVLIEPEEIVVPDHWQMDYSRLDIETFLH